MTRAETLAGYQELVDSLDPGIRNVVMWLHSYGFHTTDSGDGKSKAGAGQIVDGMMEVLDVPHVAIQIRPDWMVHKSERLRCLLSRDHGIDVVEGQIQVSYDPVSNIAIMMLMGIDDTMLRANKGAANVVEPIQG